MFGLLYGLYAGLRIFDEWSLTSNYTYEKKKLADESKKMNTWDGIEHQIMKIKERESSWRTAKELDTYSVYWDGDMNKQFNITEKECKINKEWQDSGLSADDFIKEYYKKVFDGLIETIKENKSKNKETWESEIKEKFRRTCLVPKGLDGYDYLSLYEDYNKIIETDARFYCETIGPEAIGISNKKIGIYRNEERKYYELKRTRWHETEFII